MAIKIVEVRGIKKGNYVVIDSEPCKIVNMSSSKPGKHGAAKVRIDAASIFDGRKHSLLTTGDNKIDVPIIERKPHQVLSIGAGTVQLMNMESYETVELPLPEDAKGKLKEGGEVQVMEAMDRKKIMLD